jgi:hypothetical protein
MTTAVVSVPNPEVGDIMLDSVFELTIDIEFLSIFPEKVRYI